LDGNLHPLPPGIPGELCIAGAGLARGYLNRPELTAEKFIEIELFGKNERIYKTGDLARWLPDGNLEYLGRIDNQVKLRGFRIELGEIEAALTKHEAVKEAVVTLYAADDNKRLAAYITADAASKELITELITELKDRLKARLPEYMVPSHFTVLEKLPLTPNGKIDRKALPAPEIEISTGAKPATPTEELLAVLTASVLKRETVHRDDSFFELGGHSLLATQLISRIRDSFQVELPVRTVFEHPQLSALAEAVDAAAGTVSLPRIKAQAEDSAQQLSFGQQRLWFLHQFEDSSNATYNMPAALQLSGELDTAALQQSLHWLQQRHAGLRSCFPTHGGKAEVRIRPLDNIRPLKIHDLRSLGDEEQRKEVQHQADSHAVAPFDLAEGPLFTADLLLLDEERSVLLLNMHHIISDGWSMSVFIRDWQQAYTAFARNAEPDPAPLLIQYSDYAAWQRDWLQGEVLQQQVDYWTGQLDSSPELLELPTDKPRPPQQSYRGAHYEQSLSTALSRSLTELSQQQGTTVFMTLLAGFTLLLSRYSRRNDICIGSPIANRTHSQTENIIGFFVNTLILRNRPEPEQSFLDLLRKTRRTCLEAYAHQDIPFEMLVEQLQPTRSLSHHPLFQVMMVLQNNEAVRPELPGLDIRPLHSEYPIAKFDLTLNLIKQDGKFECVWEYATDLFEAETIRRMAGHFEVLLAAVLAQPEQPVGQLSMLTEHEMRQLQTWNDTAVDFPKNQTVVDLFEEQVEKTPENIAVVFPSAGSGRGEEQELTYSTLNRRANQVAHYL
ncbi:MAG: AMP-binding protein, partial [Gammaproteobacteria bacterium]|nr:AMP-binding protein [Gammaproteobacteria bacterium]